MTNGCDRKSGEAKMPRLKVFLSHSGRDKPFVRRLNKDIKSHGFETWIDEDNVPPGGSITAEVQKALEICDVVFVFLSEHSVASKWVSNEWQSQFFKEADEKNIRVIP